MDSTLKSFFDSIDKRNFRQHLPTCGAISYSLFNLHVAIDGGLPRLSSGFGHGTINTLLVGSFAGVGVYVYNRKFMSNFPNNRRFYYTAYITTLFNLGSILLISVLKNLLPECPFLRSIFAIASSYCMLYRGANLFNMIEGESK